VLAGVEQRLGVGPDRGERRAQLVRHRAHEVALERVQLLHVLAGLLQLAGVALELLVEAGVLDRHDRVGGVHLEQLHDLARRHQSVGGVVHREVRDQLVAAAEQRHEQHVVLVPLPFLTDRKSTRLNSSHVAISYAVFCLKKKKKTNTQSDETVETQITAQYKVTHKSS